MVVFCILSFMKTGILRTAMNEKEKECLECIELDRKLESGGIKEWEIGGDE